MDPASIFSIIAGSAGLALQCGKLVRDLHDVKDMYKTADLTIVSLTTGLETIQWAWRRIQAILEIWTDASNHAYQNLDTETLHQLDRSLRGGRLVISALEEDLISFNTRATQDYGSPNEPGFFTRIQVIWNATALRDHQERLRDQMNSMNLMINVLQLPDVITRLQTMNANVKVLRKSDESAYSIVPSRLSLGTPSIWSHTNDSVISIASETSLNYRELAIDDDLFTARVYKRNYCARAICKASRHGQKNEDSPKETLSAIGVPGSRVTLGTATSTPLGKGMSHNPSVTNRPELPLAIQYLPLQNARSHGVVTGWLIPSDSDHNSPSRSERYICIPGPTVPKDIFEKQCFSEWGTRNEAYLKLDHDDSLRNIDWDELFNTSVNIPSEWLHHCCLAACAMGREDLLRLILRKQHPALFLKGCKIYRSRHPVELAFRQGHIDIVKRLLKFSHRAIDRRRHLGRLIIRRALDDHDVELLNDVLTQATFTFENACSSNDQIVSTTGSGLDIVEVNTVVSQD
ncbi:MAG: hypothetical protein Q9226_007253 [Calogaya cf. arnoldii]